MIGKGLFKKELVYVDPSQVARPVSKFESRKQGEKDLKNLSRAQASPEERKATLPETISLYGKEWPVPIKGALIDVEFPSDYLSFHFNPPNLQQTLVANWTDIQAPGYQRPLMQWTSGGPHTIPLRLFFLDFWRYGENRMDVEESLNWIMTKMQPPKDGGNSKPPSLLALEWSGKSLTPRNPGQASETFVIRDMKIDRSQFDIELITIRATVDLTLNEYIESVI